MHSPTIKEDSDVDKAGRRREPDAAFRSGVRVREMARSDLGRVLELRSVVRWSADPRAFDLLRGIEGARWAMAEAPDGALAGMVGAVPLGEIGILCQLAVRDGFRKSGIGRDLSSWAITYLRSRGARTVRLYSTREAEGLYRALGFEPVTPRTVYRLEDAPRDAPGREVARGCSVETLLFGDLPELYGADRWSYGADRSALILATLKLHPGWGLVARNRLGRLEGYLVRSALGPATRLGPFVATSPVVARRLLASALRASEGSPVEVTVPGPPAHPAHSLLKNFGFAGRADRLRMEFGEPSPSRPPGLVHYGTTPYLAT